MSIDITMIGHISKDIMIYKDTINKFTGGPVIYSSIAAQRSNRNIYVITKCNKENLNDLDIMRNEGILVTSIDSKETTSIENIYLTEDKEKREVKLLSRAENFILEELPLKKTKIIHLAGLFKNEIPDSLIIPLSKVAPIAIDAQGLLRCSKNGILLFENWKDQNLYLPYITYFKADAAEAEILTGKKDREAAAKIISEKGANEVMITHNNEVIIYSNKKIYRAPYNPSNLSGRTGRGDTTFAAYLAKRISCSIEESLFYAAALCSMKMEKQGPFSGNEKEVYLRMKNMGYIEKK